MVARLTLYPEERPARQFLLDPAERYLIGRDDACSLRCDDPRLSRQHARLTFADGRWQLTDLCSKNGTIIDGRPVVRHDLGDEQWLELGGMLACFDHVSDERISEDTRRITERWEMSMQLSRAFRPSDGLDELLERVLESFIGVSGAERGFVVLGDDADEPGAMARQPGGPLDFRGSHSAVRRTLETGRALVCSDVRADAQLVSQPSIVSGGISALVTMPLMIGDRVQGVVYVDSREPGKRFTDLDMEILEALAHHASMVIGVARVRTDIGDLRALLPGQLHRERPRDAELVRRLRDLVPQMDAQPRAKAALAGAGS